MKTTDQYASQPIESTLQELNTSESTGLSQTEAQQRLSQFGFNEIQTHEVSFLKRLLQRFWGPIPWMIEVAALLSAIANKWEDFAIIMVLLLVNGLLDFLQEHRALNALKVLKSSLATQTTALRDGKFIEIPSRELVPGDLIQLRIGDMIPADVQLVSGDYLMIDESALTGESLPVNKQSQEVAYANTVVKQGQMMAVIIHTAAQTRFHSVVALITKTQQSETSHFQKMVLQIGHFLIALTVFLAMIIILVSLSRGDPIGDILRFVLVLTVASIPVALPAVLSVTMAVGAMNLAKRQAIVSKLTAIEELAGIDIFCSDKTGTLTQNKMQVSSPVLAEGKTELDLFANALMASKLENHDPIEQPLFQYAQSQLPELNHLAYRQQKFTPFNPNDKFTKASYTFEVRSFVAYKGAPQVILNRCTLTNEVRNLMQLHIDSLASQGYRTLAVACQSDEPDATLELIGLIPLYDPPREDSKETIDLIESRGVQVKMVTGDNLAIAQEIGRLLGLEGASLKASKLSGGGSQVLLELAEFLTQAIYQTLDTEATETQAKHFAGKVIQQLNQLYDTTRLDREFLSEHQSALVALIERTEIFAEVIPEDKFKIVDTLQRGGHFVGMTGDGVNDAPALKKADCGIAVSGATDAARASADIILTQPGLSIINDAITQARETFERMRTYATFRIAETIRLILFMTLSIVIFNFYPITAIMVIMLALLNDLPILAIAYDQVKVSNTPVRWRMSRMLTLSTTLGITGVISSFLLFFTLQHLNFAEDIIQSMIFLKLVVAGHFTLWILRSEGWFWEKPFPSPWLFSAILGTEILGTLFAVYGIFIAPISWEMAGFIWLYALIWMFINDAVKIAVLKFLDRHFPKASFAQPSVGV
ncbi:plasma-membrane proton-efflux P-type ATPase [Thiosulfativibrio zosterae]|uniref:Metal-transporting ATPase n=1 Tax=Thiosulfativibrio zosterae TaxID=2675053 RepID=A0A6F8PMN8_9GAMM|nr:plasma-membrane proton-efflux P-type ATPase [Thiosulfativibrio zosterae]BBP43369.1 metal-transporting ATPase [Thiosulfativibrio zosterae]